VRQQRGVRVDEDFVPVRQESVHTVELDGEAVLLDEAAQRLHLLNATGTLVWACLDGESTVGEIVTDLSDGLGETRTIVLDDTLAITRHLGAEGLLANVEPANAEPAGDAAGSGQAPDIPAGERRRRGHSTRSG
jgi:hypothetical protein